MPLHPFQSSVLNRFLTLFVVPGLQDFWVLGSAKGENFNPATAKLNLVNPVYRSTIGLISYGWTYLRFNASNPGPWFFHCHLTSHMHMGMVSIPYTLAER